MATLPIEALSRECHCLLGWVVAVLHKNACICQLNHYLLGWVVAGAAQECILVKYQANVP